MWKVTFRTADRTWAYLVVALDEMHAIALGRAQWLRDIHGWPGMNGWGQPGGLEPEITCEEAEPVTLVQFF
jgi:hypothetical protein